MLTHLLKLSFICQDVVNGKTAALNLWPLLFFYPLGELKQKTKDCPERAIEASLFLLIQVYKFKQDLCKATFPHKQSCLLFTYYIILFKECTPCHGNFCSLADDILRLVMMDYKLWLTWQACVVSPTHTHLLLQDSGSQTRYHNFPLAEFCEIPV